MTQIVVDADKLLAKMDKVREALDDLSGFLADHVTPGPSAPTLRRTAEKESKGRPFELEGFDIGRIDWKTKDSYPAGRGEAWCWAFTTDVDGYTLPEVVELVQACKQYGEVQVGPYLIKIGGRDGNLLNRRKLKK